MNKFEPSELYDVHNIMYLDKDFSYGFLSSSGSIYNSFGSVGRCGDYMPINYALGWWYLKAHGGQFIDILVMIFAETP